jgi:hypothetical protein
MAHGKFGTEYGSYDSETGCAATWTDYCWELMWDEQYAKMCTESSAYGLVLLLLAAACAVPSGVRMCCKLKNRLSSQTAKATDVPSVV